jgi:hypothetical protein
MPARCKVSAVETRQLELELQADKQDRAAKTSLLNCRKLTGLGDDWKRLPANYFDRKQVVLGGISGAYLGAAYSQRALAAAQWATAKGMKEALQKFRKEAEQPEPLGESAVVELLERLKTLAAKNKAEALEISRHVQALYGAQLELVNLEKDGGVTHLLYKGFQDLLRQVPNAPFKAADLAAFAINEAAKAALDKLVTSELGKAGAGLAVSIGADYSIAKAGQPMRIAELRAKLVSAKGSARKTELRAELFAETDGSLLKKTVKETLIKEVAVEGALALGERLGALAKTGKFVSEEELHKQAQGVVQDQFAAIDQKLESQRKTWDSKAALGETLEGLLALIGKQPKLMPSDVATVRAQLAKAGLDPEETVPKPSTGSKCPPLSAALGDGSPPGRGTGGTGGSGSSSGGRTGEPDSAKDSFRKVPPRTLEEVEKQFEGPWTQPAPEGPPGFKP